MMPNMRPGMRGLLVGATGVVAALVVVMILLCLSRGTLKVHIVTLALLTSSGPLVSRMLEGFVRRRQRLLGLDMNCLEADDEVLIARTMPLLMPVAGAFFSYSVML
jgi:hypothetical protein